MYRHIHSSESKRTAHMYHWPFVASPCEMVSKLTRILMPFCCCLEVTNRFPIEFKINTVTHTLISQNNNTHCICYRAHTHTLYSMISKKFKCSFRQHKATVGALAKMKQIHISNGRAKQRNSDTNLIDVYAKDLPNKIRTNLGEKDENIKVRTIRIETKHGQKIQPNRTTLDGREGAFFKNFGKPTWLTSSECMISMGNPGSKNDPCCLIQGRHITFFLKMQ